MTRPPPPLPRAERTDSCRWRHLHGLDEADAMHILDSFPIVREQDLAAFGRFRTRDDVLAWLRRLS